MQPSKNSTAPLAETVCRWRLERKRECQKGGERQRDQSNLALLCMCRKLEIEETRKVMEFFFHNFDVYLKIEIVKSLNILKK